MGPLQYLKIARRRWLVVVLAVQMAALVAWFTTPADPEPVLYQATHTLIQDTEPQSGGNTVGNAIGLEVLALLTTTGDIPLGIAERLNVEPASFASQVEAVADPELGTLAVTARDEDPERAALLADTFAEEALRYVRGEAEEARQAALEVTGRERQAQQERVRQLSAAVAARLQAIAALVSPENLTAALTGDAEYQVALTERDAVQGAYSATLQRIEQLSSEGAAIGSLHSLQRAIPIPAQDEGFQPPSSRAARATIGALLGLALGLALAFGLESIDTRLQTRGSAEEAFGLPVVAEVPRLAGSALANNAVIVRSEPRSRAAEAYRSLRLSLQLMPRWVLSPQPPGSPDAPNPPRLARASRGAKGQPPRVVLVTSASAGEGKTSTVVNLAASFAEIGKRVLVLDYDFRSPAAHRYLGARSFPGVTDFLLREREASLSSFVQQAEIDGVWVVPSGRQLTSFGSILDAHQDLIREATEMADVVIIDAGPVLAVNDPAALIPQVDAVVVVARSGVTTAESAGLTKQLLGRLGAPVLGVALVAVPRSSLEGSYGNQNSDQAGADSSELISTEAVRSVPLNGEDTRRRS